MRRSEWEESLEPTPLGAGEIAWIVGASAEAPRQPAPATWYADGKLHVTSGAGWRARK
jgi:hypothetical protein